MPIEALSNRSTVMNSMNSDRMNVDKMSSDRMNNDEMTKSQNNEAEPVVAASQEIASNNHPYDEEDPLQVKDTQNVPVDKIKRAVEEINQKIRPTHTSCQYSYHEDTNRISIKVINDETDEIIREIPPEKTLDMIAKTLELEGMLVDEKR